MTNTQPQTLDEVLDQTQAHLVSALQLAEKAHRQKDLRDRFPEVVHDLRKSPGEFLSAKLKEKEMTQVALARRMGVSETTISRLIKDRTPISAERACVMEGILGIPALDFVLNQAKFELRMARFRAEKPGETVRAVVEYDSEPSAVHL